MESHGPPEPVLTGLADCAFRFPSSEAGALTALDRHLCSYLLPDPIVGPVQEVTADFVSDSLTSRPPPETPADA